MVTMFTCALYKVHFSASLKDLRKGRAFCLLANISQLLVFHVSSLKMPFFFSGDFRISGIFASEKDRASFFCLVFCCKFTKSTDKDFEKGRKDSLEGGRAKTRNLVDP